MDDQTGQSFDLHHRSGKVHDADGSLDFILNCVNEVRQALPEARIESRIDDTWRYVETEWTPESWKLGFQVLVARQKKKQPTRPRFPCDAYPPLFCPN